MIAVCPLRASACGQLLHVNGVGHEMRRFSIWGFRFDFDICREILYGTGIGRTIGLNVPTPSYPASPIGGLKGSFFDFAVKIWSMAMVGGRFSLDCSKLGHFERKSALGRDGGSCAIGSRSAVGVRRDL